MRVLNFLHCYVCINEEEKYNRVMILLWNTISKLDAAPFSIHVEPFSCSDLSFNRLTGKIPVTFKKARRKQNLIKCKLNTCSKVQAQTSGINI